MSSPLGLAAPICGIGAPALIWVAVDKAIVEIDEMINRDDFEIQIKVELECLMDEIEIDVLKGLDAYQKQVLNALLKSKKERIDHLPQEARLIDQISLSISSVSP